MSAVPAIAVGIERLAHARDLELPSRASAGAAGFDLRAALDAPLVLPPHGGRQAVPTGLRLAIPEGYEGQVRPRSGLALRHGVTVVNAPGTIDADYRGELMVAMVNLGHDPFSVEHGMRIAQIVFAPVTGIRFVEEPLDAASTARGAGGFGSTGMGGAPPTDTTQRGT